MLNTKFILLLGSVFLVNTVAAQKIIIGAKAGIQSSAFTIRSVASDDKISIESPRTGFLLGATADYKFSPNWSVQPHLLVTMRNGAINVGEAKTRVISLDLPLNLLYRHDNFFIGAGPNFSYGLSAKAIPYEDGAKEHNFYSAADDGIQLKRFELGVNAIIGYEFLQELQWLQIIPVGSPIFLTLKMRRKYVQRCLASASVIFSTNSSCNHVSDSLRTAGTWLFFYWMAGELPLTNPSSYTPPPPHHASFYSGQQWVKIIRAKM